MEPGVDEFLVGRGDRRLLPRWLHPVCWSLCARWWDAHRAPAAGFDLPQLVEATLGRHGVAPGQRLLDLGCGSGVVAVPLVAAGYRVVGVDYARGMLVRAATNAARAEAHGLRLVRLDFEAGLPLRGGTFDAALALAALHCAADPVRVLREIGRIVRPRGLLVLLLVGTRPGVHGRRTPAGRLFQLLRALPGWRRRVRVLPRSRLGVLLHAGGFEPVEDLAIATHLLLVARRGTDPAPPPGPLATPRPLPVR